MTHRQRLYCAGQGRSGSADQEALTAKSRAASRRRRWWSRQGKRGLSTSWLPSHRRVRKRRRRYRGTDHMHLLRTMSITSTSRSLSWVTVSRHRGAVCVSLITQKTTAPLVLKLAPSVYPVGFMLRHADRIESGHVGSLVIRSSASQVRPFVPSRRPFIGAHPLPEARQVLKGGDPAGPPTAEENGLQSNVAWTIGDDCRNG